LRCRVRLEREGTLRENSRWRTERMSFGRYRIRRRL
jgi:hypothetical protein